MDKVKQRRLEAAGWTIGTVAAFLALSDEKAAIIELRLRPADRLRRPD